MPRMIRCAVLAAMTVIFCTLLVGADEKTLLPTADAQKQAEKLIKDVFKADYAKAKLPADKAALAEKLLAHGIETKDDLAARFVMFREARDLAAEVGAMTTCFKAVDAMAKGYGVDVLAMKADALTLAAKSAPVPSRKVVAEMALAMTDEALAADNYDAATRLATVALTAARSGTNTALTQQATLRVKDIEEIKTAYENLKPAQALLKDKPTDAEANSLVGKFLCLMKGEWDKGVPMLALGKDPELKRIAEMELAKPADGKEKAGVGDGWWDLADKVPAGKAKSQLQRRAGHWYREAVSELTGLSKAKVEKRLTELEKLGLSGDATESSSAVGSYPSRGGAIKKRMLREGGGNEESERAVALGLAWLAKQQKQDGGWEYEVGSKEERVAATGMALLAFLGAGETHQNKGEYAKTVQSGVNYLVRNVSPKGAAPGRLSANVYANAIGTIALCEAYGMTKDKNLFAAAQAAINYIIKTQAANGSWGYTANTAGDTSIVGWQVQALRAAQLTKDIVVPPGTIKKAVEFLNIVGAGTNKATYGYADNVGAAPGTALSAIGLLSRYYIDGWGPDNAGLAEGITGLMKRAPVKSNGSPDVYFYYYATQIVHFLGGDEWKTWNEGPKGPDGTPKGGMRDWLISLQNKQDGPNKGSFEPDLYWIGRSCGRLGTTAMYILTLEVYYRHLPVHKK